MQAGTGPEAVRRLRGDDGEKIEVNAAFRPAEGAVLLPGVTVGKLLGTGMAVRHHRLAYAMAARTQHPGCSESLFRWL